MIQGGVRIFQWRKELILPRERFRLNCNSLYWVMHSGGKTLFSPGLPAEFKNKPTRVYASASIPVCAAHLRRRGKFISCSLTCFWALAGPASRRTPLEVCESRPDPMPNDTRIEIDSGAPGAYTSRNQGAQIRNCR
jgi:hypothetical protein